MATSSAYKVSMDLTGPLDIPTISEVFLNAMARDSIAKAKSRGMPNLRLARAHLRGRVLTVLSLPPATWSAPELLFSSLRSRCVGVVWSDPGFRFWTALHLGEIFQTSCYFKLIPGLGFLRLGPSPAAQLTLKKLPLGDNKCIFVLFF